MLHFASGAVGFVDLDSCLGLSLEIQGTCGRMVIDPAVEGVTVWEYRSAPPSSDRAWYQGSPCMERTARHPERASAGGSARSTMIAAIEELISCLETGLAPRSKGEDGRAALEIALAVHASHARGGERVALPLDDRRLAIESR